MIELPEARTIAKDLRKEVMGKTIVDVRGNFTDHKFTFYYGDPEKYKDYLTNKKVTKLNDRNYYVELEIEDYTLVMRDGANIRYYDNRSDFPEKSKLLLEFQDGSFLNMTTSMYAMIAIFKTQDGFDNDYYQLELNRIGAFDPQFTQVYFLSLIDEKTEKMSLKAFLATEQRILGIGNGVLQDILFQAKLHPKRKVNTLSKEELETLYHAIIKVITEMNRLGGRDTEKDIYGEPGNYRTILSSNTYKQGCPNCHGEIKKESYLGGSIYYCPNCQK